MWSHWRETTLAGAVALCACNAANGLGDYTFDLGEAASTSTSSTSSSGGGGTGGGGGTSPCGPCDGECRQELPGLEDDGWILTEGRPDTPPQLVEEDGEPVLVLTQGAASHRGLAFHEQGVVANGFSARFDFRISETSTPPGDGLAFVVQRSGAATVGLALGVAGLKGIAFEVDLYSNTFSADPPCDLSVAPHVGFSSLEPWPDIPDTNCRDNFTPYDAIAVGSFDPTVWYTMEVSLTPSPDGGHDYTLALLRDDATLGTLEGHQNLDGQFGGDQPYFYGFGAGTGSLFARHAVRNVVVTFPEPVCFVP